MTRLENHPRALFTWILRQPRQTEKDRGGSLSGSVNLLDCKECCRSQLSWDPDTVLWEQPMGHVGGNEFVSASWGAESTRTTCFYTYIMQDVHTQTVLQEIKMISDQDYNRISRGNKRLDCAIRDQEFAKTKQNESLSSSHIWQQYFLYILDRYNMWKNIISLLFFS